MSRDYGLGKSIMPGDESASQTAAGSSISDATSLVADYVIVATVATGTGVALRELSPREEQRVFNAAAANSLLVYPYSSSVQINGATAGAAVTLPAGHGAIFMGINATNVGAIY